MKTLCALSLLLLASPSRADVAIFPLWDPYGAASALSRDGYHLVKLSDDKSRVFVDGREAYKASTAFSDKVWPMAAISADGSSWAVMRGETDDAGEFRLIMAINGKALRRAHTEVRDLTFSPKGANIAYLARGADGKYSVVSAQGAGPAFEAMPGLISVGDNGVLYNVDWQGRRWLYRDHNPGKGPDYHLLKATPDLAHVLATYKIGREYGVSVDGAELGRYPDIGPLMIDKVGRPAFFYSTTPDSEGRYDRLYFDGRTSAVPAVRAESPVLTPAGVFWSSGDDAYLGADKLGSFPRYNGPDWAGASPTGRHWAFLSGTNAKASLIVDGRAREAGLPPPMFNAGPVFDGENALHYMGHDKDMAALVCVTLDESPAARGACARKAAALKPRASAD